jgi:hypothetical protein
LFVNLKPFVFVSDHMGGGGSGERSGRYGGGNHHGKQTSIAIKIIK